MLHSLGFSMSSDDLKLTAGGDLVSRVEYCPGVVEIKTPFAEIWDIDWPRFDDLAFHELPSIVAVHVLGLHDDRVKYTRAGAFAQLLELLGEHEVLTERARALLAPELLEESYDEVPGSANPFDALFDDIDEELEQEHGFDPGDRHNLMYWLRRIWPALSQALARSSLEAAPK